MQWDDELAAALSRAGFTVHMETNGTRVLKAPVDWLTVSPKPQFHGERERLVAGHELDANECKVVVDTSVTEETLIEYESQYRCEYWSLQPCMVTDRYEESLSRTLELIYRRPRWKLSLQLHKIVGLP